MSFQRALKVQVTKHFSGWNYNGDGRFPTDRVKKKDKKRRTRYRRRIDKRWAEKTVREYM